MQFSPEIVEVLKVGLSVKLYVVNLPAGPLEPRVKSSWSELENNLIHLMLYTLYSIAIENTASYIDDIGGFNGKITRRWQLR